MKEFHWPNGIVGKRALTVGELMDKLGQYARDMPVLAEWEGQLMPIGFYAEVEPYSAGMDTERCDCLILNAECDTAA